MVEKIGYSEERYQEIVKKVGGEFPHIKVLKRLWRKGRAGRYKTGFPTWVIYDSDVIVLGKPLNVLMLRHNVKSIDVSRAVGCDPGNVGLWLTRPKRWITTTYQRKLEDFFLKKEIAFMFKNLCLCDKEYENTVMVRVDQWLDSGVDRSEILSNVEGEINKIKG